MIDSSSGDLEAVGNDVPSRLIYVISDEPGFAGDADKAFEAIKKDQESLLEKEKTAQDSVLNPYEGSTMVAREERHVRNQGVAGVILVDYTLAQAAFNATYSSENYTEYRGGRASINRALEKVDASKYRNGMGVFQRLDTYPEIAGGELASDLAVDAGIVMATAPLFANSVGPLMPDQTNAPRIRQRKYLDANDLRDALGSSFVVPCYSESRLTPGCEFRAHIDASFDNYYRGLGVPSYILDDPVLYSLATMCDYAVAQGSLLPISLGDIKEQIQKAFYVVWASPDLPDDLHISYEQALCLSEFLSSVYDNIEDSAAYFQSGSDIVDTYISTRFGANTSDVKLRMWVYLCADNHLIADNTLLLSAQ